MFNDKLITELGLKKNYEFIKDLKIANFEKVLLLRKIKNKKEVICKIKYKAQNNENETENLLSEIWAISQIKNINIAKIHFILLNHKSLFFYVIEKLHGPTLQEFVVQHDKLDEGVVKLYFGQMLSAINYLHSKNIVLRYLNNDSFMLNSDLTQTKLIEFRGCLQVDFGGLVKSYCKTNYYSSPQVHQNPDLFNGFKADVWALGVILYFMMTKNFPFKNPENLKNLNKYNLVLHESFTNSLCEILLGVFKPLEKDRFSVSELLQLNWVIENFKTVVKHQLDSKDKSSEQSFTSVNNSYTFWRKLSCFSDTSTSSTNHHVSNNLKHFERNDIKNELNIFLKKPKNFTNDIFIQKAKTVITRNRFIVMGTDNNNFTFKGTFVKQFIKLSVEFVFLSNQQTKLVFRLLSLKTDLFNKVVSIF